jgi:hypothetical protein
MAIVRKHLHQTKLAEISEEKIADERLFEIEIETPIESNGSYDLLGETTIALFVNSSEKLQLLINNDVYPLIYGQFTCAIKQEQNNFELSFEINNTPKISIKYHFLKTNSSFDVPFYEEEEEANFGSWIHDIVNSEQRVKIFVMNNQMDD